VVDLLTLFDTIEDLPLEAVQQVHDFINSRPHKVEKRSPTSMEQVAMVTELESLVEKLRQVYKDVSDEHPDIQMLEKMANRR